MIKADAPAENAAADIAMNSSLSPCCPSCGLVATGQAMDVFHGASLYACEGCDLHFWHPVSTPDGEWHESLYTGRDQTEMPLEPGHLFFLSDHRAPKQGKLLDVGCGVGNFLAAAQKSGFDVSGIEINRNAARFAQEHYGLSDISTRPLVNFLAERQSDKFDIVTFFEVLEHQEDPQAFLNLAKSCLLDRGYIALSVPNRGRWQKGIEQLDYPPNHLTRWSPRALENLLVHNGFEVLTMRQEPLTVRRAAQVLGAGLPTGFARRIAGGTPPTPADLREMRPEEMQSCVERLTDHSGHRMAARLVHFKTLAMVPLATLLLPYLRLRGRTGLYLYCLARRK